MDVRSDSPREDSDGSPVVVEYQLTSQELARAVRWQLLRRPLIFFIPAMGVVLIALGAVFLMYPGVASRIPVGIGALALGVYQVATFVYLVWRIPKRAWRRNEAIRGPQTLIVSDADFQAKSTLSEGRSQWAVMKSSYENAQCYMMRLASRRAYIVVPKRGFASAEDERRFRRLIERHTESHLWSQNRM